MGRLSVFFRFRTSFFILSTNKRTKTKIMSKTEKNTKKRTKIKETKNTLNEAYNKKDLKQKEVILIFRLVWIGFEFGTILGA